MEQSFEKFKEEFSRGKYPEALITARNLCNICAQDVKERSHLNKRYDEVKKEFEKFSSTINIEYKGVVGVHIFHPLNEEGMNLLQTIIQSLVSSKYKVYFYTYMNREDGKHLPYTFTLSNPRILYREDIQEKLDFLIVHPNTKDISYFHDKASLIFSLGAPSTPEYYHGVLTEKTWKEVLTSPNRAVELINPSPSLEYPSHPLEKYLNLQLDGIVCISLVENVKERELMDLEAKKVGIPLTYYLAKRNEKPWIGCMDSHYQVIRMAKVRRWRRVAIFEADAVSIPLDSWPKITVPEKFDILYLGCNCLKGWRYRPNLIKVTEAYATHAYIVDEGIYDLILGEMNKTWWDDPRVNKEPGYGERSHTNDVFNRFFINPRGNSYVIYPMIYHQRAGYSSTQGREVDFTEELNNRARALYEQE